MVNYISDDTYYQAALTVIADLVLDIHTNNIAENQSTVMIGKQSGDNRETNYDAA